MLIEETVNAQGIQLVKVEERAKSNTKRLDEVEAVLKENTNLIVAIKELAMETKYMREDLNATIERLTKLEENQSKNSTDDLKRQNEELQKQADKWDKFKWLIVAGLVTIILGAIAMALGLK